MKAVEQYFPVVLFVILYKVISQMKAVEQYFPVWLFFNTVQGDFSNESY